MQYPGSQVPIDAITNTKVATVLATLGLTLAGTFITYDKEHPQSSGGVAHFVFETSLNNTVQKYLAIYDAGIADVTLDKFLDSLKGQLPDAILIELEAKFAEALVVYGRKFLDNYNVVVKSLKKDIAKFVVTGGEPVYSGGEIAGIQNFSVKGVK
jgi:hypothetical protein